MVKIEFWIDLGYKPVSTMTVMLDRVPEFDTEKDKMDFLCYIYELNNENHIEFYHIDFDMIEGICITPYVDVMSFIRLCDLELLQKHNILK